jgi:hypothetical protein
MESTQITYRDFRPRASAKTRPAVASPLDPVESRWRELARRHNYKPEMGAYTPAMSFEDIAVVLSTDRQHVWHWYASGIRKLRENPAELRRLLCVANDLERSRQRRLSGDAVS